jgi:hypothetical protein
MRSVLVALASLIATSSVVEAQPYYEGGGRGRFRQEYREPYDGGQARVRQRPPVVCFVDPGLESYRSYPWCEIAGYRPPGSRCTCPSFGQTRLPGTVGPR